MMEVVFFNTDSECDEKKYYPRSVEEIIVDATKRSEEYSGQNSGGSDGEKQEEIDKHNTP